MTDVYDENMSSMKEPGQEDHMLLGNGLYNLWIDFKVAAPTTALMLYTGFFGTTEFLRNCGKTKFIFCKFIWHYQILSPCYILM